ncbi:MAG: hypothetical protein UR60_C0034G0004 [Candidatus Moranbacteria bacterium GW2011_GWF2_34_56]|nr:MAG: hypothetical protein UR51_C0014G0016 [Candidatus Moranbacteria bacterium GW2011_GWF1_34_10]KKP63934.1 MAG: hypothetical protein UR60_C0034G0004 [Candidatus Moranbacteria bacterium GW2011_GWF2_34_56]HBI17046.1 hypothetical protein [Candidatus Moranbacteria bacterium]
MKNNYAQKIIEKIKQEKIVPKSRFFLNWKNYVFWLIWLSTLFLGAIFFSFIILNLLDIHPLVIRQLGLGKIFFILARTAPYLWIFLALLAGISGFMAIRKTKRGYRYSVLFITSIGVLFISMLGAILHMSKVNRNMGGKIFIKNRISREMAFPMEKRWRHPEEGMLGGQIIEIKERAFDLRGFNGKIWEVHYSDGTKFKIKKIEKDMNVAVIGEKFGENKFRAFLILQPPFNERPMMRR